MSNHRAPFWVHKRFWLPVLGVAAVFAVTTVAVAVAPQGPPPTVAAEQPASTPPSTAAPATSSPAASTPAPEASATPTVDTVPADVTLPPAATTWSAPPAGQPPRATPTSIAAPPPAAPSVPPAPEPASDPCFREDDECGNAPRPPVVEDDGGPDGSELGPPDAGPWPPDHCEWTVELLIERGMTTEMALEALSDCQPA